MITFSMTSAFDQWLLRTTWQVSLLVCLVLFVQTLCRDRLSSRWRFRLWWLVIIKLLCPVFPASRLSALNLVSSTPASVVVSAVTNSPRENASSFSGNASSPERPTTIAVTPATAPPSPVATTHSRWEVVTWSVMLRTIWFIGVLSLLGRLIYEQKRMAASLQSAKPIEEPGVLALLLDAREQLRLKKRVVLLETDAVQSPALYGFFQPRLLLPVGLTKRFSGTELRYVLLHELAHIKHHDIALNWLLALIQVFHWFNPFVWLAMSRMRTDREVACDARVLSLGNCDESREYGATVIKLLETFNARPSIVPSLATILEGKDQMRLRIKMIAHFGTNPRFAWVGAILIAALGVVFLTEAQPKPSDSSLRANSTRPDLKADEGKLGTIPENRDLLFLVLDGADNSPLSEVQLKITCCRQHQCSLLGRFATPASGPANIRYPADASSLAVHLSKEGYVPKLITWQPSRNDLVGGQYFTKLEKGSTIGGYVRDSDGQPVADAKIFLSGPGIEDPIAREHSGLQGNVSAASTDVQGRWTTSTAPEDLSRVSFGVEHPQFAPGGFGHDGASGSYSDRSKLIPLSDLRARRAVFTLNRGQTVMGEVLDSSGRPIRNATVLLGEKFAQAPRQQKTDENGRFRFDRRSHETSVTVEASGYAPDIKFVDGKESDQQLTFRLMPGGVIKGKVFDEQHRPLSDVTVSVGTAIWRGIQTLSWDTTTDEQGRFAWDSAPLDGITIGFMKRGYMIVERSFHAGGPEETIVLEPERRFAGLVTDADSGEPISELRVTPGESFGDGASQMVNWQPFLGVKGRNGTFLLHPERSIQLMRIEADGYIPLVASLSQEAKTLSTTNTFKLKRSAAFSGVVRLPNGSPATGAEVAVRSRGSFLELGWGKFNRLGGPEESKIATTDTEGRFSLPAQAEVTSIVAVHEKGYLEIPVENGSDPVLKMSEPLVLKPWGRLEGVLHVNHRPASNQAVALTPDFADPNALRFAFDHFQAKTDKDGRFDFAQAPPGKRIVSRLIRSGRRGWTYAYATPVIVKPGELTEIIAGGSGRQVIGRASFPSANQIDWKSGIFSLQTKRPRPPAGFKTADEVRKWAESPDVQAALAAFRSYPVILADDGSFTIDDIPAGNYELNLTLTEPGGALDPTSGLRIGALNKEVTIADTSAATHSPLDLGLLELLPVTKGATGPRPPFGPP